MLNINKFEIVFFFLLILMFSLAEEKSKWKKYQNSKTNMRKINNQYYLADDSMRSIYSNYIHKKEVKFGMSNSPQTGQPIRKVIDDFLKKVPFAIPKKIIEQNSFKVFINYLSQFEKDIHRFKTFEKFKEKMNKFNELKMKLEEINSQAHLYKVAINQFSDKKIDTVMQKYTGLLLLDYSLVPDKNVQKKLKKTIEDRKIQLKLSKPINWVAKNKVSPVGDQKSCGVDWAFASAGMLESFKAIKTNKPVQPISRKFLLDCLQENTGNPGSCEGGHYIYGIMWAKISKFPLESSIPSNKFEKEKCPNISAPLGVFYVDYILHKKVTPGILYKILKKGPVAINLDINSFDFIFYSSGVLKYRCDLPYANHSVLLVGYGIEPNGKQYWLIQNSWGKKWGINGYAKLEISNDWDGCRMYTNVVELF